MILRVHPALTFGVGCQEAAQTHVECFSSLGKEFKGHRDHREYGIGENIWEGGGQG